MKKRLLSALLAMAMMLTMAPAAFATDADADDTVQKTVSSTTANTDDNGDTVEDSGSGTSGSLPEADENGVIKLTGDTSIDSSSWTMSNSLTIDLDHHTLNITNGKTITVPEGKTLTIRSGNITANSFNALMAVFSPLKDATLVLDGVDFTTSGSAILPSGNAAKVEVKDSTIKTTGVYTVGTNANKVNGSYEYGSNFVIELTNSTFTADSADNDNCAVQINVPGTLNIDNCTVTGDRQGMMVRAGTANITNSTIKTTGGFTTDKGYTTNTNWGSGNEVPTAAITIGNYVNDEASSYEADAKVTITDTKVESTGDIPAIYVDANTKYKSDVTISGEKTSVTGDITKGRQTADGQINISITGGTFSSQVSEDYLPTGYECTGSDSTWTVKAKQGLEADVSTGNNNTVTATVNGNYTGNETTGGEESSDGDVSTASGVVTIDVSVSGDGSNDIKSAEVTIGSNALTSISENTSVNTVVLKTNVGSLAIDAEAWNSMTKAADDESGIVVTVTDKTTGDANSTPVYEVTATAGDNNAFGGDAEGTVTISVPYTPVESKPNVKVYCTDSGMEDMNGELVDDNGSKSVQWTTSHFSTFEIPAYGENDEAAYLTSGNGSSVTVGEFSAALTAVKESGGTIALFKDVSYDASTACEIKKPVTIQGSNKIDVSVPLSSDTSIKTAFVISSDGSITLDGVTMNVTTTNSGQNTGRNAAFSITSNAGLALVNGATLNLDGLQSGMIMPGSTTPVTATVSVSGEGSAINAKNIKGNFSNGGQFTIEDGASLTIDGCGSHGLSANKVTVDNASVTVKNTGLCGIVTVDTDSAVELKNGATMVVENCATAEDNNNRAAVDLSKSNASMTVDKDSTLTVSGTGDRSDKIALAAESGSSLAGNIVGSVQEGTSEAVTYYQIAFNVTPSTAAVVVKNTDGTVQNNVNNAYALKAGTYTYEVSADGYNTKSGSFTVSKTDTIIVTLSKRNSGSGGSSSGGSSSSSSYSVSVSSASNGSVSVSPKNASKGATVTITVTPNSGYELGTLTVTDKDGKAVSLTNKGDGKYTFTMPASKVTVKATFEETGTEPETPVFTDVSTSAYYYDAVLWAVENDVTKGTSATTFSPDMACTRAQMVTFLWRAAGSPAPTSTTNPFTDVSSSAYYYDAVLWAVENDVTKGTSATTFSPDMTVTRGQTVTFLYRDAGSPAVSGTSFSDVAADAYYADAVTWAVREGVTNGTSATTFSPNAACTRAQIVTFLYRAQ